MGTQQVCTNVLKNWVKITQRLRTILFQPVAKQELATMLEFWNNITTGNYIWFGNCTEGPTFL